MNPANEGRGYVLRKILRRGIRHGRLLGKEQPFMHEMVHAVVSEMQVAYPELSDAAERVAKTVLQEEQQFARVLSIGSKRWEQLLSDKFEETQKARIDFLTGVSVDVPQLRGKLFAALSVDVSGSMKSYLSLHKDQENILRDGLQPSLSLREEWLRVYSAPAHFRF